MSQKWQSFSATFRVSFAWPKMKIRLYNDVFQGTEKIPIWVGLAPNFFSAVPRYFVCVPSLPDLNGTAPHQIQCALASLQLFAAVGQTSSSLFLAVGKFFEVFAITKRGIGSGPLSVFSSFASKCLFAGFWQFFFSRFFFIADFSSRLFFHDSFFFYFRSLS